MVSLPSSCLKMASLPLPYMLMDVRGMPTPLSAHSYLAESYFHENGLKVQVKLCLKYGHGSIPEGDPPVVSSAFASPFLPHNGWPR
jgi:hypothetical protein